jgi:hypothetical protein
MKMITDLERWAYKVDIFILKRKILIITECIYFILVSLLFIWIFSLDFATYEFTNFQLSILCCYMFFGLFILYSINKMLNRAKFLDDIYKLIKLIEKPKNQWNND